MLIMLIIVYYYLHTIYFEDTNAYGILECAIAMIFDDKFTTCRRFKVQCSSDIMYLMVLATTN